MTNIKNELEVHLKRMKNVQFLSGIPDSVTRKSRLKKIITLLVDNKNDISEAINQDFHGRHPSFTQLADIRQSISHCKHTLNHIDKWMKIEKRTAEFPLGFFGAKAVVHYQPKGVVGIMSPWNFPISMIFDPLCDALAAGNRVMIKPSEHTPKTSRLVKELIDHYFSKDEIEVFLGGVAVGEAFSSLDFDHLFFTGATSVGKKIMRAAADNLTPVTLELGGKSPVVVDFNYPIKKAAEKIISGKAINSGQVCLSPDYVYIPESKIEEFILASKTIFNEQFPTVRANLDYTAIINIHHFDRITNYLDEARQVGVRIIPLSIEEPSREEKRLPIYLIIDPPDNLSVMQDEIFGPLLVIKSYKDEEECYFDINKRPTPLAFYYFSDDKKKQIEALSKTTSGGVTINDVIMHVGCNDLPFGGAGASGIGYYHGKEGFKTFSNIRSVLIQSKVDVTKLIGTIPPYGEKIKKILRTQIKK